MDHAYDCYAKHFFPLDDIMDIFHRQSHMAVAFRLNCKDFPWKRYDGATPAQTRREFSRLWPAQVHFGAAYKTERRFQLRFYPEKHLEEDTILTRLATPLAIDIDLTDYTQSARTDRADTFPVLRTAVGLRECPEKPKLDAWLRKEAGDTQKITAENFAALMHRITVPANAARDLFAEFQKDSDGAVPLQECEEKLHKMLVARFRKSWLFIAIAAEIVSHVLVHNFNCADFFWVVSGNKGVHCIITDEKICSLGDQNVQEALHNFIACKNQGNALFSPGQSEFYCKTIYNGSQNLKFCYSVIEKHMDEILKDQDLYSLANKEILGEKNEKKRGWARYVEIGVVKAIVFALKVGLPRLDRNMLQKKHLFKAPFSVNIQTGVVSVPMHAAEIRDLDPRALPTITDLQCNQPLFEEKMKAPLRMIKEIAARERANIYVHAT